MNKWILSLIFLSSLNLYGETPVQPEKFIQWAKNNQYFRKLEFKSHAQEFVRLVEQGQTPKALFIGCSDSRVVPDLLLGTNPGDLFVIRNAGNFVPTYNPEIAWDGVAASIVYAAEVLKIKEIIVCGHSHCGAIQGLYQSEKLKSFSYLNNWINFGIEAKKLVETKIVPLELNEETYDLTARLSVLFQLEHLLTYPEIKRKVEAGELFLHGWYNTLEKGKVEYYDPELGQFVLLDKLLKKGK